ncbi:MAG TPA: YidC/Oxa1 family membrane protein insertase [Acidimicrobiales bacterium]|nr:YidC/Oxa1 family membrane protein insertase [Acidimicrobiales bacterium]
MIHAQILGGITITPIAKPVAAVLAFFYSLIPNYGIAIILLTIAMMIVLTPLTIKQTRSMLVMQKLQPEMKKLQEQHKNDRAALNEAVMALYKEHNASPLGGCLPMLLPFPLFIALLRVLEGLSRIQHPAGAPAAGIAVPKYLTAHTQMYKDIVAAHGHLDFFGMDLAKSARNVGGGFGHALPYFVLLLLMVGTQFYQQYQLTRRNPAAASQPGQAAMMKFIPLFFGLISLSFPAGVVVYWTVSNAIRIGQQWALYRYDPKVKALVAEDVKEIEAKTREIDDKKASPKAKGSGFRGLLANAAEAAADRKNQAGKGGPATTGRPGADRTGSNRPGAKQPGKSTGSPAGGTKRPAAASGGTGKAGTGKGGAAGKGGAPAAGAAGKAGGTAAKGVPAGKPPQGVPRKPAPAAGAKPNGTASPGNGTNGGGKPAGTPANGAAKAAGNGALANPEGADSVPSSADGASGQGNGASGPKGGRTGAGSARNVSSRHRRRGR